MSTIRHLTFDHYLNYEQLTELLHDLAAAYPDLATLHAIGQSHRDRTVWLLELHNSRRGPAKEKPGYYIDANIHAEEISGTSVVVYTAWTLLSQYGRDPLVTQLMDEQVFYLVPRLNPDGAEFIQTLPFYEWIGNGRFLPGEEQFGSGLHYADVNGDGFILDMRFPDPAGDWKKSTLDDRLMVPRAPDEYGGTYYRVVPEGRLVDWDGADFPIPRPQDGNMNRNFPSNWAPESQQYGAGEYPLSEPEVAAVVRWIQDHPNIAGIQSYHTHSGVILRPWLTHPDSHFQGNDKKLYEDLGRMGVEETGYPLISIYEDFTPDKSLKRYGSLTDWTFGALGIPTFGTELWDIFKAAGIEREDYYPLRPFSEEENLKLLRWQDEKLNGAGFLPWTPFDHPQLGPVEIGGWKRVYTFRNPPPEHYLEEMAQINCRFTLRHAAAAPRLGLRGTRVTVLEEGVYHLETIVANNGFLSTNISDQALHMNAAPPVTVTLTGPAGMRISHGSPTVDVGHLAGRHTRQSHYSRFYDWPTASRAVAWTVQLPPNQPADLVVAAVGTRAGTVRVTVHVAATGDVTVSEAT